MSKIWEAQCLTIAYPQSRIGELMERIEIFFSSQSHGLRVKFPGPIIRQPDGTAPPEEQYTNPGDILEPRNHYGLLARRRRLRLSGLCKQRNQAALEDR